MKRRKRKSKLTYSQALWLTTVFPSTWEAEIERIVIRGQPQQNVIEISQVVG
jgi:hypothetical protein